MVKTDTKVEWWDSREFKIVSIPIAAIAGFLLLVQFYEWLPKEAESIIFYSKATFITMIFIVFAIIYLIIETKK